MVYRGYVVNAIKGDTTNNWVKLSGSTMCNVTEEEAKQLIDNDILNKDKLNEQRELTHKATVEFYNKK